MIDCMSAVLPLPVLHSKLCCDIPSVILSVFLKALLVKAHTALSVPRSVLDQSSSKKPLHRGLGHA